MSELDKVIAPDNRRGELIDRALPPQGYCVSPSVRGHCYEFGIDLRLNPATGYATHADATAAAWAHYDARKGAGK